MTGEIAKIQEMLARVRAGIAAVADSQDRIRHHIGLLIRSQSKLDVLAEQALQAGRADLARDALIRRESAECQLSQLAAQAARLKVEEAKLNQVFERLQAKADDLISRLSRRDRQSAWGGSEPLA